MLHQTIENASSYNDISAVIDTKTFGRIETYSYPEVSLREGILNAFCHADFFIRSNIKIEFFPTYLKVTNPGGIYKASLEDIMSGIQTYRNPGLVNIFNKLKLIENFGTGIPRINNSYSNYAEKPLFKPSDNFFTLTLPNVNTFTDPLSDPLIDPLKQNLSDFDLLVLKTIYNNPGLNTKKLLQFVVIEDSTATVDKIKNSLKIHLKDYCEFKGNRSAGGYYVK